VVEFVVTYPQAVTGLASVDGIGAIGERIAHVLQRSRWRKQLGFEHSVSLKV
jgi:hypothetical protein